MNEKKIKENILQSQHVFPYGAQYNVCFLRYHIMSFITQITKYVDDGCHENNLKIYLIEKFNYDNHDSDL